MRNAFREAHRNLLRGWLIAIAAVAVAAHGQTASVYVPADSDSIPRNKSNLKVEPMTFRQRARYFVKETFSPAPLLIPALPAAIILADPPKHYPADWRQGSQGFARNFGDGLSTEVAANTGQFLVAALTHEDPRYYPDQRAGRLHRSWHALSFTIIDRNHHGRPAFAFSTLAGTGAAGFVGRAYLPPGYNDLTHAAQRSAGTLTGYIPTLLVGYATGNLLNEFSPELKRLGRKLHLPFIPEDQRNTPAREPND